MRKALTIAASEFMTALSSKAFIVGVLLIPGIMVISIVFQRTMAQRADREERTFAVLDESGKLYPVIAAAAELWNARQRPQPDAPATGPTYKPSQVSLDGRTLDQLRLELSDRVARQELFAFLEIPAASVEESTRRVPIRYYSNHPSYGALPNWLDTVLNAGIAAERLRVAGVDVSLLRTLQTRVPLESLGLVRKQRDGQIREAERVDRIKTMAIPVVLMTMMFMVIMSSASPLLNSVMEEKMTRISEVMLGSVTPFELMLGKLLGSVGVSQVLSIVYMIAGFTAASYWNYGGAVSPVVAAWFLVYLTMAVLMFGAAFMAIGAACTDLKDAQGMMTPIMLLFILPFFVWQPVLTAPDSLFATVVSLIPIATPMLMLLRLTLQPGPPVWQVALSLVLTLATSLVIVWAAGKIFRTGILMQGKSASLREMFRWVRA